MRAHSVEANQRQSEILKKRYKEHPESFHKNTGYKAYTDGSTVVFIRPESPVPEGFEPGNCCSRKKHNMSNYYSNKEMQNYRKQITSGVNNGMYGKGYKLKGGKNGHATIRFFYKDKVFESRVELIEYLDTIGAHVTSSVIRSLTTNENHKFYGKYANIVKEIQWEYKDENKVDKKDKIRDIETVL